MNSDLTIRKVLQVAEQAQMPIYVPVLIGNEWLILALQEKRRIEDIRLFSYNKVNSKGELVPIETRTHGIFSSDALGQHSSFQQNNLRAGVLPDVIAHACNVNAAIHQQQQQMCQQQQQHMTQPQTVMPPDLLQYIQAQLMSSMTATAAPTIEPTPAVTATLQQQLDWAKACGALSSNATPAPDVMFPLHHTTATSTTEFGGRQNASSSQRSNATKARCCNRACNTMDVDIDFAAPFSSSWRQPTTVSHSNTSLSARQQAKQRKMLRFGN